MHDETLIYVGSPKHKDPWQHGRKGTLCPPWSRPLAQELLNKSEPHPDPNKKIRYTTHNGLAFAVRSDNQGGWHGFPVNWSEVPVTIRNQWMRENKIQRSDVRKEKFPPMDEKRRMED